MCVAVRLLTKNLEHSPVHIFVVRHPVFRLPCNAWIQDPCQLLIRHVRRKRPAQPALCRSLQRTGNRVPGAAAGRSDLRPVQPDTIQSQYLPVVGHTHDLLNEYCTCFADEGIHYTGCSTAAESLLNSSGRDARTGAAYSLIISRHAVIAKIGGSGSTINSCRQISQSSALTLFYGVPQYSV